MFAATYLIPILACLIGLLCFRFLSQFDPPDPPRAMRIDNSGTDPNHQVLFWAKFGDYSNSFDFEVCKEYASLKYVYYVSKTECVCLGST